MVVSTSCSSFASSGSIVVSVAFLDSVPDSDISSGLWSSRSGPMIVSTSASAAGSVTPSESTLASCFSGEMVGLGPGPMVISEPASLSEPAALSAPEESSAAIVRNSFSNCLL